MNVGDILIIPPHMLHELKSNDGGARFICLFNIEVLHFSRLFKQHTHTTFYDYLCRKRIQEAQYLLSTESNITEIAFKTGFNNLTTFCRCFKKVTNYSPSEYRSQLRPEQVHL